MGLSSSSGTGGAGVGVADWMGTESGDDEVDPAAAYDRSLEPIGGSSGMGTVFGGRTIG